MPTKSKVRLLILFLALVLFTLGPKPPEGHRTKKDAACSPDECLEYFEEASGLKSSKISAPGFFHAEQGSAASGSVACVSAKDDTPLEALWTVGKSDLVHLSGAPIVGATASFVLKVEATPWNDEDWARLPGPKSRLKKPGLEGRFQLSANPTDETFAPSNISVKVVKVAPGSLPELLKEGITATIPPGGSFDWGVDVKHADFVEFVEEHDGDQRSLRVRYEPKTTASLSEVKVIQVKGVTTRCYIRPTITLLSVRDKSGQVVQKSAKQMYVEVPCPQS